MTVSIWSILRGKITTTLAADGSCNLCEKHNNRTEPSKRYENMARWLYDDVVCYPGYLLMDLNGVTYRKNCIYPSNFDGW